MKSRHSLEKALESISKYLIDGYKAWIMENGLKRSGKAPRMANPANGIISIVHDWAAANGPDET
jgi:hypothetical protein